MRDAVANGPAVLWLNIERYLRYTDYCTVVKAAGFNNPPPVLIKPS